MGDQLSNQIVAVDEEHYGLMDAADPDNPASDSLVMVVYNVQDEAYYDCAVTTYTAGYFAPDYIDSSGMNVIVVDALDWANRVGPDDSPWRDDDPANDRATLYEGVIAHELEHLLHNYSDPGELSWVDEGLADFAIFLNGYDVGGSHLTYHQVYYADTSLTRWGGRPGELRRRVHLLPVPLGAGGRQRRRHLHAGPAVRRRRRRSADQAASSRTRPTAWTESRRRSTSSTRQTRVPTLRDARTLYQDWAVAVYLDDEELQTSGTSRRSTSATQLHDLDDRHRRRPVLGRPGQQPGRSARRQVGSPQERPVPDRSPVRHPGRAVPQPRSERDGLVGR